MFTLPQSRVQTDHALQGIVARLRTIPALKDKPFPIQNTLESFIGRFEILPYIKLGSIPQNAPQVKIDGLRAILTRSFPCYSVWTATKTTRSRVIDNEIALSKVIDNEKSFSIIPKMGLKMKNHYQNQTNQPILRAGARARARTHRKF